MKIRIAQVSVTKDVSQNKAKILDVLASSQEDEWVIFPEGMLSGYYPEDEGFIANLDWGQIDDAIQEIQGVVCERSIQCIFGTAFLEENVWYNAAIYMDSFGRRETYRKVNLASLDKKCFTAGNRLDVFEKNGITFGIQLCRDNAFPEQWKVLKKKGAQVIFHINNSIKETDINRKHVLISRAFENQYFVASVNNAERPQTLPSLVIAPFGEILFESKPQIESVDVVSIDLSEVKTDYLGQERTDLVEVVYKV